MTAATPHMPAPPSERTGLIGWVGRAISGAVKLAVGVLMCLTPVTAIIALGWFARKMAGDVRRHFYRQAKQPALHSKRKWPNWLISDAHDRGSGFSRWTGGLRDNLSAGLAALAGLGALTLPFGILWLLSWWAGWENSFNKGYEQAWVGPVVALIGVSLALLTFMHLPMATAHQAVESTWRSVFDFKRIRGLLRTSGWSYVGVTALYALAALPLFAAKGAPVFMEQIYPPIVGFDPEQLRAFADAYHFWMTAYLFVAVLLVRSCAARVYARAAFAAVHANPQLWAGSAVAELVPTRRPDDAVRREKRFGRLGRMIRGLFLIVIWLFFVAQIFVGQFLNHSWSSWVNQPLILLPWLAQSG